MRSAWCNADARRAWVVCVRAKFWGAMRFPDDFFGCRHNDEYLVHAARTICPDFGALVALREEELEAVRAMCDEDTREWAVFTAALVEREIRDGLSRTVASR